MKQLSSRVRTPPSVERAADGAPTELDARLQSNLAWGGPGFAEQKVDIREILRKLWRGRRLIALTVVTGCLLGYVVMKHMTPLYEASASVMLETRHMQVLENEEVLSGLVLDAEVIEGEIELLRSRELGEEVAKRLKLQEYPEFNPALTDEGTGFAVADVLEYLPIWVEAYARDLLSGEEGDDRALTDQQAAARLQKQIVDTYLDQVSAGQIGRSPVIRIAFSSQDPQTAANIANAVAETYISSQLASKYDATRRASNWIEERIARLRAEVEEKERAIEAFRARSGLLEGREMTLETQQMVELATQLTTARVERQAAESRLQQVQRAAATPGGASSSSMEVLNSDLIASLRVQEAELRRTLAEASVEYGPNHPTIISQRALLDDIQGSIAREINKIGVALRNEVESARQREEGIQAELDTLSERVAENNASAVELRALEREVEASRTLLESLLARAQETAQQEGIQRPDAKIISAAQIPEFPSYPNGKLFMALAFCASAFAGVSLAYLLQALDQSFHTANEVNEHLGLPVLELVPFVRGFGRNGSPADSVVEHPNSSYAEALRSLQVTLFAHSYPPKTFLFTSSLPGEGKTSLTLAFARFLAMSGRSVVVVDCDLRRSTVHTTLGGRRSPGLVDHLLGRATLDQIIQNDDATDLHFIASGPPADNPPDLFASRAMHSTVSTLTRRYDVVLIDSAPVLAVADTRCLQSLVEQTVFVVRWRTTNRSTAREAVRRMHQAGLATAGVVLNMVDPSTYGEYDTGYSYKAVKSYYGE